MLGKREPQYLRTAHGILVVEPVVVACANQLQGVGMFRFGFIPQLPLRSVLLVASGLLPLLHGLFSLLSGLGLLPFLPGAFLLRLSLAQHVGEEGGRRWRL